MQGTQLINATVTANQSRHGVSFLSMSAGSELEPGPSWPGRESSQKMVHRLGVLMMARAAQAMARLAGWGEFTGGERGGPWGWEQCRGPVSYVLRLLCSG